MGTGALASLTLDPMVKFFNTLFVLLLHNFLFETSRILTIL